MPLNSSILASRDHHSEAGNRVRSSQIASSGMWTSLRRATKRSWSALSSPGRNAVSSSPSSKAATS